MFERYGRRAWLGAVPLALIAVVDLATGDLTGDRRVDVALLAATAMVGYSTLSLRRLARRFREPEKPQRATAWMWIRGSVSLVAVFAATAGLGYLIGGTVAAIVLPSASLVLMLISVGIGLRRRRELARVRELGP
jgi:drug/metabolite transporter (DMT)-like permease